MLYLLDATQMTMLQETFITLANKYTQDLQLIGKLWSEIQYMYSEKNRHYHTLLHLTTLLFHLSEVKAEIKDWDTVLFAVFYHDIIYQSTSTKNEEKSAALAGLRLSEIKFPSDRIDKCASMILATKAHTQIGDNDTDYFTDADLSILGQPWDLYAAYAKQVRKEYAIYPTFVYNRGRKKVIRHFLEMNRIFKTAYFFDRLEEQARENMLNELKLL